MRKLRLPGKLADCTNTAAQGRRGDDRRQSNGTRSRRRSYTETVIMPLCGRRRHLGAEKRALHADAYVHHSGPATPEESKKWRIGIG